MYAGKANGPKQTKFPSRFPMWMNDTMVCFPLVCILLRCYRSQWLCSRSFVAKATESSGLFTVHVPCVLEASFSVFRSVLTAMFVLKALFVLVEVGVYALSLRWLRVMVTLKVCVCCSSILSSCDNLMKGHQANA